MLDGRGRVLLPVLVGAVALSAVAFFALRAPVPPSVASADGAAASSNSAVNSTVASPAVPPPAPATFVALTQPGPSTELQRAEAHLDGLPATEGPLARLRATAQLLARRCRLGPMDRTLQPPECLAGLDQRVAVAVGAAGPERDAFVAAVDQAFIEATEPPVIVGLLRLHGSHLSSAKPVLVRLEVLASGTQAVLAELAAQRLLSSAPAPDGPSRALAERLLRDGNGRAVPVACEYLGRPGWAADPKHGAWLLGQILHPTMRAHARHGLVGALEHLGAVTVLAELVTRLAGGTPGDLAVRAAAEAALTRLGAAPSQGR